MLLPRTHFCSLACVLVAALGTPLDALATDYFVRKTGNDASAGTSSGTAWLTVDHAADSVTAGDTIYIGAGTYTENIHPAATCLGTAVSPIRFVADTDGSQTGDAGDVVLTAASGIVLQLGRFGVVNSYVEFDGFKIAGSTSHAIFSDFSTGVVFDGCDVYGSSSNGIRFDNNQVTIRNCLFHGHASSGIYLLGTTGIIEDTSIYANNTVNSYSGILLASSATATLNRCRIYGNLSTGISVNGGTATINNSLITENTLDGISVNYVASNDATIQNCTIASNTRYGISLSAGTNAVTNCIIANNGDTGFTDSTSSTRLNNLLYGNGSGNTAANSTEIVDDPQFVSSTDYRITMLSPALNAGTDLSGVVGDDLEGRVRPYDGGYDIGCYEEGPIAHWKHDETSGTTSFDSSGFSHDGTHSGSPTWSTTGSLSGSLDFETSDGVDRVDAGNFDVVGTGLSLIAWVRQEDPLHEGRIIMKSNGNSGGINQSWGLTVDDSGALDFHIVLGGTWSSVQALAVISPGTWYHVAGTYDGTTMRLYLDGQLIASAAHPIGGAIVGDSSHTVTLGDSPTGGRPFDGLIDDARIYDRTLTASEIAALFASDGLVGHWKLDETSGTTAADSSSQANDGTYTNGPTLGVSGAYPGEILNAAEFDGTDDHVDLPNMNLGFSNGFSIALWVKPATTLIAGQFKAFLDLSNGSNVDEIWLGMVGGPVGFQLYMTDTDDGSALKTIEDNSSFEEGKWVHCVATVDAAGNAILYRNGEVTKSGFYTSIPTSILRAQNSLATSPLNDNFPGTLDDVRLYNRPLSATEVSELYGLTGHWKMDEGAGATVADSTAFGNDASINGATWSSDCTGNNGLEFDGVADTATTNAIFDPPATGAVTMWLRSAGNPGARSRPFGLGGDWEMRQEPDGTLSFDLGGEGPDVGAGGDEFTTNEGLSFEDRWYHVVAQFDAGDDSFEIYINGELVKSGVNGDDMTEQAANMLSFGTRTGNTEYWEGGMRDFRVYNRWLGGSEISDLSGLVGYWKLDESSGTVAVDSSANGNDGTYTNGATLFEVGQVDQAASFDGSDDYVGVPDDPTLQMDNVFSLSGWIRPDSSSNIDQMILNKEGEYEIAISPSDELKWGITNTDPGWSWHSTGHIVAIGKWTHVALIYDNGTVTTYANGVLVDTYNGSGSVGDQYTSLNELRLGGRSNNPAGKYFDGLLDDVRVFKRVLCPEEVFGQYKSGRPAGVRILEWVEVR